MSILPLVLPAILIGVLLGVLLAVADVLMFERNATSGGLGV